MIKTVKGNLITMALNGEFDVIVHGANCFCTMGAGVARQIKIAFPSAFEVDKITIEGDKNKLGTCTWAECVSVTVVNAYTQFGYGGSIIHLDYDAVRKCMKWIAENYKDKKIGLPKIGAGLGGGDWNKIKSIIEEELDGLDVTIVEWGG